MKPSIILAVLGLVVSSAVGPCPAAESPPPTSTRLAVEREIRLHRRYLHFPVRTGAPKARVEVVLEGRILRQFEIELSDQPEWWAFLDVKPWRSQTVIVRAEGLPAGSRALEMIDQGNAINGAETLYRERLRPQFHFTSRRGWNNDPNGLVYFEGTWHLFYQHNPYGWNWGNMHWGHAVSRDLVHWKETGDVLFPDAMGTMFSGSAVVDWQNTSGFGRRGVPPLVLFYTAAGGTSKLSEGRPFTQCLAYSTDKGRTWIKYAGNPVLPEITPGNRDPKVIWHEPSRRWIMTLYVEKNREHTIQFYASENLRDWAYLSEVAGFFECPDFFELLVDGNEANRKWVLTAASSEYMVGAFDGTKFTPETPKLPGHRGKGFYAAQTYSDAPKGRRVQIGWGQMPSPGMPFNQMMCFPCELTLRTTPEGPRLHWAPVPELEKLRGRRHGVEPGLLAPGENPLATLAGRHFELNAVIRPATASVVGFVLRGNRIAYDAGRRELTCNDVRVPLELRGRPLHLRVLCDETSLEVFAQDGLIYAPLPSKLEADNTALAVFAEGGQAEIQSLEVHPLRSIWR